MSSRGYKKVAVVMGGFSSEREVSLITGQECSRALKGEGFEVIDIVADIDLIGLLKEAEPDVIFNALHGRWGEDGCAQGIFEWLQIPYTHSGVHASSTAMDKIKTKEVYEANQLPTPQGIKIPKYKVVDYSPFNPPYVIKPVRDGSSVGVEIVHSEENCSFLGKKFKVDYMLEKYIPGRELTVSVLDDNSLNVTEIVTKGFYDYHAKYSENGSCHEVPAKIPKDVFEACLNYAEVAHRALGCEGLSRTDFRWDDTQGLDGLILLETNTQPGMTPTSLSPEQASLTGMDLGQLCRKLVEMANWNK